MTMAVLLPLSSWIETHPRPPPRPHRRRLKASGEDGDGFPTARARAFPPVSPLLSSHPGAAAGIAQQERSRTTLEARPFPLRRSRAPREEPCQPRSSRAEETSPKVWWQYDGDGKKEKGMGCESKAFLRVRGEGGGGYILITLVFKGVLK